MPILRKEPEIHPAELFSLPFERLPWLIAHVRSRQEKMLARHLLESQLPYYLPQTQRRVRRNGRTVSSHTPLFPGYVFLRSMAGLREALWRTSSVVSLLDVTDQERLHAELLQIRELEKAGASLQLVSDVAVGDPVRITEGVFRDYHGVVVEERGSTRLIVSVSMLRKQVAVEFLRPAVRQLRPGEVTTRSSAIPHRQTRKD